MLGAEAAAAIGVQAGLLGQSFRKAIIVFAITAIVFGALAIFTSLNVKWIEAAHPPAGHFVEVEGGRLHVVEMGKSDRPALVLLHGATTNLEDMRLALGARLAADHHVVLIDRPGHGYSDRPDGAADASPVRQAQLVHQALQRLKISSPILVAHSWSGSLSLAYALEFPAEVKGLLLLAPVTNPWPPKSVAWHDTVIETLLALIARSGAAPILGPFFAHTLALPFGKLAMGFGIRSVFWPQQPPADYVDAAAAELFLRPSEFVANAEDISKVQDYLTEQAPRYPTIRVPTVIVVGDSDSALDADVHSKTVAKQLPNAKLIVLHGAGHMVHFADPDRVVQALSELADMTEQRTSNAVSR